MCLSCLDGYPHSSEPPVAVTSIFFAGIRLNRRPNLMKERSILITTAGGVKTRLSLVELLRLPVDRAGYHELTVKENRRDRR